MVELEEGKLKYGFLSKTYLTTILNLLYRASWHYDTVCIICEIRSLNFSEITQNLNQARLELAEADVTIWHCWYK